MQLIKKKNLWKGLFYTSMTLGLKWAYWWWPLPDKWARRCEDFPDTITHLLCKHWVLQAQAGGSCKYDWDSFYFSYIHKMGNTIKSHFTTRQVGKWRFAYLIFGLFLPWFENFTCKNHYLIRLDLTRWEFWERGIKPWGWSGNCWRREICSGPQ